MTYSIYHNEIIDYYKGTDLHVAAINGDLDTVEKILSEHPEQYKQLTTSSTDSSYDTRQHSGATVLHYALMGEQYDVAERLLKHPQCNEIINIPNSATESILQLIAGLKDKGRALHLAKLALGIEGIDVNFKSSWIGKKSSLSKAFLSKHLEMTRLLLDHGADPNVNGLDIPILDELAQQLRQTKDKQEIQMINSIMLLLIEKGADPEKGNPYGKTFFDFVMDNKETESNLDPRIKNHFKDIWKQRSPDEIQRSRETYWAVLPFDPDAASNEQSPSLMDTALLINLKKERRLANNDDYDCTVLSGRGQLDSFIQLAKLRFDATKQPFETQFIMRPRKGESPHVANGQLSFDAAGHINVFWVDTLGHDHVGFEWTKQNNKEIGEIISKHLPHAQLYTTDITMQSTEAGCHNLAMYISEQLSVIKRKQRNLFADLEEIHKHSKREEDGFRIIPWDKCPAYTGVPRIIQSASKPLERIKKDLEEDKQPINKKNQNYKEAMEPYLVNKQGKIVNMTYDTKRQNFGNHIKQAYEQYYPELNKKRFAGFTDIVDRIPPKELAQWLKIKLSGDDKELTIDVPRQYTGNYFPVLKGTLSDLTTQLENANLNMISDTEAFKNQDFLFYYAAIRAARGIVDSLELGNNYGKEVQQRNSHETAVLEINEIESDNPVTYGIQIEKTPDDKQTILARLENSPEHTTHLKKIKTMYESIEELFKHGQTIGENTEDGKYAIKVAEQLRTLTTHLAASYLPDSKLQPQSIAQEIQSEIETASSKMNNFRSYVKPILSFLMSIVLSIIGPRASVVAAAGYFSKTERQIKLEKISNDLVEAPSEEQNLNNQVT